MDSTIRPFHQDDLEAVVRLSLLAWVPVFRSFKQVLGPEVYSLIWPDWEKSQKEAVETACQDPGKRSVWVAEVDGTVVGFVAIELHEDDKTGEIYLLAVHPDYQNRDIGTDLNVYALERIKESGMKMAVVETGGDPSHAPARRSYEKAGLTGLPLVRYYKSFLSEIEPPAEDGDA